MLKGVHNYEKNILKIFLLSHRKLLQILLLAAYFVEVLFELLVVFQFENIYLKSF
jgi:hypothetical protein